jgi:putative tryptophan/tyrosine transport system substrate-binding protein
VGAALVRLVNSRPQATLIAADIVLLYERRRITDAMSSNRIPAIYPFREYAEVGGFIVYGANFSILFERAATYVDRILKGEPVQNLSIQQADAFELIINLKEATHLDLAVPGTVLVRSDEVIE